MPIELLPARVEADDREHRDPVTSPPASHAWDDGGQVVTLGPRLERLFGSDPPSVATKDQAALVAPEASAAELEQGAARMQFILLPLLAGGAAAGIASAATKSPAVIAGVGVAVAGLTFAVGYAATT